MTTVYGQSGVSAKVLCDSISEVGIRLLTFEVTYPRLILSELNTHKMISKSSASSRAIPFKRMQENLTGQPVRFGEANAGMQDKGSSFSGKVVGRIAGFGKVVPEYTPEEAWAEANKDASFWSKAFYDAGYSKQVFNRLSEPFQVVKTVLTATEWANFFFLRDDDAADPTIASLARCMREAMNSSTPQLLSYGEYHLPYVESSRDASGKQYFWWYLTPTEKLPLTIDEAIKVSCARTAAVSFRAIDYGLPKCLEVYEKLVGGEKKHSSACEMAATPMPIDVNMETEGVTALHKKIGYMSGNLAGWLQHRQFVEGNTYYGDGQAN